MTVSSTHTQATRARLQGGHVVVLYGGVNAERAVSLVSGKAVATALERLQIPHTLVDTQDPQWMQTLLTLKTQGKATAVFIALHGGDGEDGTVQAVLDSMGLPYNGSGVLASALAMHKEMAKVQFAHHGVDVPAGRVYATSALPADVAEVGLPLPLVVKPVAEGSSIGVYIIREEKDWAKAMPTVVRHGQDVLVEEYVPGRELTVAVLGDKPLGVTEIISRSGAFYDYDAKYSDGGSDHILPADVPADVAQKAMDTAVVCTKALGCRGAARVDFRYTPETGRLCVLELNNLPGLTPKSLLPEQATYKGMTFEDLIKYLLEDGLCALADQTVA